MNEQTQIVFNADIFQTVALIGIFLLLLVIASTVISINGKLK